MNLETVIIKKQSKNENKPNRVMIGFGILSKEKSIVYSIQEETPTQTVNPSGDE